MSIQNLQETITNQIIELLENVDEKSYQAPFAGLATNGIPRNPITAHTYQGINILALWLLQESKEYASNEWATYKQWKDQDCQVKKGEKASKIVFYKTLNKTEVNAQGKEVEVKLPMIRYYQVFNAMQVEGYEPPVAEKPEKDLVSPITVLDEFCKATKAEIRNEEAGRAFYRPKQDFINMPLTEEFVHTTHARATENYYATLFHELTHWTGASHRLNREEGMKQASSKDIAFEELIAELGAAFLCAQHDLKQSQRIDHAIYIKGWLEALQNDRTFIFKAAAKAGQAMQFLNELQEHSP